jgi:hypothetical protein
MSLREIKDLSGQDIAAPDCHLFMWITGPHPPLAFEVIKAWGFRYRGIGFVSIKLNKVEPTFLTDCAISSPARATRSGRTRRFACSPGAARRSGCGRIFTS